MRLSAIEIAANRGNVASPSFNLRYTLRFEVLPEFYRKVKEADPTWLRRHSTISILAGTRLFDLPDDFERMLGVFWLQTVGSKPAPVRYIGEDPMLVAAAELATVAARPLGYYIIKRVSDGRFRSVKFDRPADIDYAFPYTYRSQLRCADDSDDPELDQYIPEDLQQALIVGLRREIYLDSFGKGDMRAAVAADKFEEILEEARNGTHDFARRNHAVYSD